MTLTVNILKDFNTGTKTESHHHPAVPFLMKKERWFQQMEFRDQPQI